MNESSGHLVGYRAIRGREPSRPALLTLLLATALVSGCDGGSAPAVNVNQPAVTTGVARRHSAANRHTHTE